MQRRLRAFLLGAAVTVTPVGANTATLTGASETIRITGCDISLASYLKAAAEVFQRQNGVRIEVEDGGATRGIRDVAAGISHAGGACRRALDAPEEKGVRLVPVAWDALVVVVHPSNPVDGITLAQLRAVLTGGITRWSELGGADEPIRVFDRTGKMSGVGYGIRSLLFDNPGQEMTKTATLFPSTRPLEEALERSRDAIGVTGVSSGRSRALKMLTLEGRAPTRENLVSGRYLLYRPLYLVTPENPSATITAFRSFLLSAEGQALIHNTGTVSLREATALWGSYRAQ